MLCICLVSSLGIPGVFGAQAAQEPQDVYGKEQMVLEAIRSTRKSIHVVAPRLIAEPIFAELLIRHKSRTKENKIVGLEIMAGDANLGDRFARMGVSVWASPRLANGPEVLIIDQRMVIKNFNSLKAAEAVSDPVLAKRQVKLIKKDRKSSEKIRAYAKKSKWWWVLRFFFSPYSDGHS
jgi:hypothetical protein